LVSVQLAYFIGAFWRENLPDTMLHGSSFITLLCVALVYSSIINDLFNMIIIIKN